LPSARAWVHRCDIHRSYAFRSSLTIAAIGR
jgi:hypothetical protein